MQDPFGRGSKGGDFFASTLAKTKQPPGLALLAKEQAALKRQAAGKNPSVDPLGALLHGHQTAAQHTKEQVAMGGKPVGGIVFNPLSLAIDQIRQLPSLLHHARETGAQIGDAAKGKGKLPSTLDIVMSGAVGFPRAGVKHEYEPRTITHNDFTHHLPKARSRITNVGERLTDRASEALQNSPHVKDLPGVRLMTSGERVAKAAGRSQRIERVRAAAEQAAHLKAIKDVKPGSPEDVANFWYAQLPHTHRNAQGLTLVRDKQAKELMRITSGKAFQELTAREAAVKAKMTAATEAKDKLPLLQDLEDIRIAKTDLPQRANDVAASVSQIDKLIAKPPVVNEAAIRAVHALGEERQRILVESGRLHPSKAENRKWLVANWLDATPTKAFGADFTPPRGVLFHGSPDGLLGEIDTYHHTRPWEEGIGLYITEDFAKSKGYAQGRTARGERRTGSSEKGVVNYVQLKPGSKVLDMNAPADLPLWQRMSGFDSKDFEYYIVRQAGEHPTNQGIRDELLDQLRDSHGGEAVYALEEAYAAEGIQATTHIEGKKSTPHRVWVVKDPAAVEKVGGVALKDLQPQSVLAPETLTGTDAPAYIGHRQPRPENSRFPFVPSGGTGRVASPQGMARNDLVLATTGRLRQSTHIAAEDFGAAQVFHQANVARADLAKLGPRFTGHVPEGHSLVNPKGRTIPLHWKTDELAQFQEGYEDIPKIREQAKQILDGFVATDRAGFERMKKEAVEQGVSWDELRVVPNRLIDRYYSQYRPLRSRGPAGKVYDTGIDAVSTSIIFARIGYIPKNFVQNLIMAAPHQGAFLPQNAVKAAQAMADPDLRHLVQTEVGNTGATGALGQEAKSKKVLGAIATSVSRVADDPIRVSALLHELQAAKVIPRSHLLLSAEDKQAILRFYADKTNRPLVNDVRSRTVEAMADFSRMTPDQSRMARRFLIIPGWLMAGSRYPLHFAATHPIRAALLAYIAMGEPGAPNELHFNSPLNEYFHGSGYKQGIDTPWGRERTSSLNPVTTPWDLGQAVVGTAQGKTGPFDYTTPTIFDEAQPLLAAGVRLAQGEGLSRSLTPLAPNYGLISGLINPKASTGFPGDATRLGRLKREVGILPIAVNDSPKKSRKGNDPFGRGSSSSAPAKDPFGRG